MVLDGWLSPVKATVLENCSISNEIEGSNPSPS